MAGNRIHILRVSIYIALLFVSPVVANAQILIAPDLPDSVIVVPGIVGSYNMTALFADKQFGNWGPVPFYKIYQGLVARLEYEGYVKNEDLYVAYYDWRQGNAESAREYLAPIIAAAKEKTGRVDIIAHSMGGLLVQQYIASDQYTPGEIDQFVMLGTPNEGAIAAYLPWEGGVFPATWSKPVQFYMNYIHQTLRRKRSIEDVAPKSYRQIFPSLKELLPVGAYISKGGSETSSSERNTFLEALIAARNNLLSDDIAVTTIAGDNNNTLGNVAVSATRSQSDEELERWRDGHPLQEVPTPNTTAGDKTVLKSSALFGPNQVTVANVPHDALPERAQNEALKALGIENNNPKIFTYQEPRWLTGFVVLSPVDIVITDANGNSVSKDTNDFGSDAYVEISDNESADDPKVIILQNLPNGTYVVHLTGTGTGSYTVITTHTNKETSTSTTLTGTTTLGKQEVFTVKIDDDSADVSDITPEPKGGTPAPRSSGEERSGEKDCCPGKDPVQPTKKIGRVLGSSIKKHKPITLEELKPLNDTFFSVYNRMPTFAEWQYWAKRYEHDKRDWKKLYGAMCWHYVHHMDSGSSPE